MITQYEKPTIEFIADELEDVITGSIDLPEVPITLGFQLEVKVTMKKKYILVLICICLVVGMFFVLKPIPTLQDEQKDDKITNEVSDDKNSDETDKTDGTKEEEDFEIPLESGVDVDQSQLESSENEEDDIDDDGDVELPAVPIQQLKSK